MTNLIKFRVGDIIVDKGKKLLLTNKREDGSWIARSVLPQSLTKLILSGDLRSFKRIRHLGEDPLNGEDWICHDQRCFPSTISDGCEGCRYKKLLRERKRYFEPGDEVWIPSEKRSDKIKEAVLVFQRKPRETPIEFLTSSYYTLEGLESFIWSVRFRTWTSRQLYQDYYRWDELRLIKRKRHFLNKEQLLYICSDLCIFGKGSTKCEECKTKKLYYDL